MMVLMIRNMRISYNNMVTMYITDLLRVLRLRFVIVRNTYSDASLGITPLNRFPQFSAMYLPEIPFPKSFFGMALTARQKRRKTTVIVLNAHRSQARFVSKTPLVQSSPGTDKTVSVVLVPPWSSGPISFVFDNVNHTCSSTPRYLVVVKLTCCAEIPVRR
jgi:hypothetical protein